MSSMASQWWVEGAYRLALEGVFARHPHLQKEGTQRRHESLRTMYGCQMANQTGIQNKGRQGWRGTIPAVSDLSNRVGAPGWGRFLLGTDCGIATYRSVSFLP